jgi:hypothetical protein
MRHLVRLCLVSCLSGVILGLAVRLAMRFVALESGMSVGFSVGGSLEVIVFGAMLATPVALAFFAVRSRVARWSPSLGVAFGLLLFATLSAFPPPSASSALAATPDTPAATAVAFAAIFVLWGVVLESLARWIPPGVRR